jgi:hypothetical protein
MPMTPGTPDAVAACLAAAADGWLRGDWDGQSGLVGRIAAVTGFHPAVVATGIADHFIPMSLAELRRWRDTRRGPARPHEAGRSSTGEPSAAHQVAILPAGNIPGVALLPAAAALLVGADVLIKTSRGEPWLMSAWRSRLARHDERVAARVTIDSWDGDEPGSLARLAGCDRVIILGSDETIDRLRPRLGDRLIGLGTGTSLAVVSDGADPAVVAQGMARDVAIWDQAGCLSPQELVVIGSRGHAAALAEALAAQLERIEPLWPAGSLSLAGAAGRRGLLAELAARGVTGAAPPTWGPADGSDRWLVWLDDEPGFAVAPARRHVAVRYLASLDELVGQALPPRAHRQAIGLDPGDPACAHLAVALRAAGVPVILPLGSMQSPPVDWPNKGHDLLAELMGGHA